MTAFGRLWKRAPFWRFCLIAALGSAGMAAFFPTPFLKHHLPWLPGGTGFQPSSAGNPPMGSGAGGPDGGDVSSAPVGLPDIRSSLQTSLPIAGRTVPLPAGRWHPVLTTQLGPHRAFVEMVLARMDRGVVTGIIVARATESPLPGTVAEGVTGPCHDDRLYLSHILETREEEECRSLGNAVPAASVTSDPFIAAAFDRLVTLGFPLPPLMINASWRRAVRSGVDATDVEVVDTLIAPVLEGSSQLIAPPRFWDRQSARRNPDVARFIARLDHWMHDWSVVLRQGFEGKLNPKILVPPLTEDPSAPARR